MKIIYSFIYFLTFIVSIQAIADSLLYQDKKLEVNDSLLNYKSRNISFSTSVKTCKNEILKTYLDKFIPPDKKKLDKLKEKKMPVIYQLNGKSLSTHQGSKIHGELEGIGKNIMLLKFKLENKC